VDLGLHPDPEQRDEVVSVGHQAGGVRTNDFGKTPRRQDAKEIRFIYPQIYADERRLNPVITAFGGGKARSEKTLQSVLICVICG
jgi:hypothetical protein